MARILVVDDEPDLRSVLRRVLERAGHEVLEASDGRQALQIVAETPPDLVVTDLMMPVMGGAELIRWLRASPAIANIPILVVTSSATDTLVDVTVMPKPYEAGAVLAVVNELLNRKGDRT